jgi:hypothetical protein
LKKFAKDSQSLMRLFSMKKSLLGLMLAILVAAPLSPFLNVAQAASINTAIRGTSTDTVYWYANDGKRYVFPNTTTYFSWFPTFNNVQTISDSDLYAIQIGGNVTMRPGANLVKVTTDPKTYAVSRGGILRWVTSEYLASQLFGSNWNTRVVDVPDAYFTNYTVGSPIYNVSDFNVSNEYNGVSNPGDSLRGMSSNSGSTGSLTLNASQTSIAPGAAVTLSVNYVYGYNSGYRIEIYDTRNNGLIYTCNLPSSYCSTTVYPQRNSTENSVQYYAALRDSNSNTIQSGYAPVITFDGSSSNQNNNGTLNVSVDRTSINSGDSVNVSAWTSSSAYNASRIDFYDERNNTLAFTCYTVSSCNQSRQVYRNGSESSMRFYAYLKDWNGSTLATAYSNYVSFNGTSNSNGSLTLSADRTSIASGQAVTLTATYTVVPNTGHDVGWIIIYEVGNGNQVKNCHFYTTLSVSTCSVTVYPNQSGRSSTQYYALVSSPSAVTMDTQYGPTITFTDSGTSTGGTNYINGLVLNADRTSITAGQTVHLTANAFNAGTWNYTGNRIEIRDINSNQIVKTCYDQSWCEVDAYPVAQSSTNLSAQYQAKIYDRNGNLAMSQYSPVIYLSSYTGSNNNGMNTGSIGGQGYTTIAPSSQLHPNGTVYLTATFTGSNLSQSNAQIQIFTEQSSTPVATCTNAFMCSVSFATGASPINTRAYARLSDRNDSTRWLETSRTDLVTTW